MINLYTSQEPGKVLEIDPAGEFPIYIYLSSDRSILLYSSSIIELLNDEELQSVIAHEVAHFYYQHALYPQASNSKSRTEILNLLNFSRAAEISADRIGFIGCGSLEASLRAMLKITSGLDEKHLKFNFSSYLNQLRELKEIKGDKNLMYSTHPNFLNRMQALIWFSMSNEYNDHFDTGKKGTFDLKTIDNKIYESIKKVIGDEVDYSNKEVVSRALMWGSIDIFLSDKKFSKKEQEIFKKNFGDKSTESIISLIKISNPKSIQEKINNTFDEASKLLNKDKEKIINELTKLLKIVDGDKKVAENVIKKIPELSEPNSVTQIVKFAKQAYYNGNPNYFSLPSSQENRFIMSYFKNYKPEGGKNFTSNFVDSF